MKIFVITLDGATGRQAFMREQLDRLGLNYEFFAGVDGRKLGEDEVKRTVDQVWANRYCGWRLSPAEIGCALSHLAVYRRILDDRLDAALILEDDAWLTPSVPGILAMVESQGLSRLFDVLLLSECYNYGRQVWNDGNYSIYNIHTAYFTHAYIVTKAGVERLLNILRPVTHYADCWGWLAQHKLVHIMAMLPVLVTQNQAALGSSTSIQRDLGGRSLSLGWITRKVWRAYWKLLDRLGYHVPRC